MRIYSTQLVFSLLFLSVNIFLIEMGISQNSTIPVNVGVVLNMNTYVGKMGMSCISMALSDFYVSHGNYNTRLVLNTRDSNFKDDVVGAAAAAIDLVQNKQVQAIIGPLTSMQANFIISIGDEAQVPIVTFSATSPSLSSLRSPYFFQATQNDSSQVKAISAIIKAYGWREVVPIYVDNEYGEGIIPFLSDALQEIDARVPYRSVISPSSSDDQIEEELYKRMTMQNRVFVVHMFPTLGVRLFAKAKNIGMMSEGYVWIVTDGMVDSLNLMDQLEIDSMQGVVGIKTYVPQTKMLEKFRLRWKQKFQKDNPTIVDAKLNIFGLWAYDAATALAMAMEKVKANNFTFLRMNFSGSNPTELENLGISQVGPKLCQALSSIRFKGLTADFHLVDGQLRTSTFEIVNVVGNGERRIGFWNPASGFSKKLNFTNTGPYSTSRDNINFIIWPGDTTSVPKGWVIPTNGKRLRIGVPANKGFKEFVKVTRDPSTNTTTVTGYCIDVFNAVLDAMPYAVPYEFTPYGYKLPNGTSSGSYNDLVYQVYLQNYDAVVGDVTIVANRSLYVDFTLPYTKSGVIMIVPIKDNRRKNAWIFLKPLTWDLWLTIALSFVFIGFVIWVLEHLVNEEFRGPLSNRIGIIFWYSFSTMVFAQNEKIVSNLARFVVIVWVLVVLILTQSYTASLTSMLTVQQLTATFTDVNELIKTGEYVGYDKGSFVLELLKKMKFDESKLKTYNSLEELDEAFAKGSANGGIAAAFDEIPYMKLFLGKYCSKYTMVGPTYQTAGFGFVFPKGSPLVPDVSRAVLNVTQGDRMAEIERAWFQQSNSPDSSTPLSSHNLGLNSFWGLFLIAAVVSVIAITIHIGLFMQALRYDSTNLNPRPSSLWEWIVAFFTHLEKKDLRSGRELLERIDIEGRDRIHPVDEVSLEAKNPLVPPSDSHRQTPQEQELASEDIDSNEERLETPISHENNG